MSEITNINRPSYLTDADDAKYSDQIQKLNEYGKPLTIKVIQGNTGLPYKPPFAEGDAIITPEAIKIGDEKTPFTFIPLCFFSTFVCVNPYQMRGTLSTIREFSFDPNSDVAKKARAFTVLPCPQNEKLDIKYRVNLNWFIIVDGLPQYADRPIHLRMSGGDYKYGQSLITLIQGRWNNHKAPSPACRFRGFVETHTSGPNSWKGLGFLNDPIPFVEDVNLYKKYDDLATLMNKGIEERSIDVDLGEDEDAAAANAASDKKY